MGTPLRLALIGTGGRGQIYADVLRRLPPGLAEWRALCDHNPEILQAFAARNGLGVPLVHEVGDLLRRDDLDAVLVCTPDSSHRAPAARAAGRILHLGFVLRYDPCACRLRDLIASGAIGRPIVCMVHEAVGWFHAATYMRRWNRFRRCSGDLLLHKGCHTLDLVNAVTASYPRRVAAFGGTAVFVPRDDAGDRCDRCGRAAECLYYADQGDAYRKRFYDTAGPQVLPEPVCVYNVDKDTSDTVTLIADYDQGMRLSYTMTLVSPRGERRLVIVGTGGEIRCDLSTYRIELSRLPDRPTEVIEVPRPAGAGHQHHDLALLQHFLERIRDGDDPSAGIRDAAMSGAVAFAALESMACGQPVAVPTA